ncbi:MAG: O-antigen ligase family protein [Chloroflexi bacterium]|nr:O-antigen ligase family protein [Chloroflexota bacterium]
MSWATVRNGLLHRGKTVRWLTLAALCLAVALPIGALIGGLDFTYGSAAIIALAAGYLMLRSNMIGLTALIAIICLLPFAAVPINIGFSPTFLDLVLVMLFFVWLSRIAMHREGEFIADAPTLPLLLFTGLAIASFVLGISNASLSANLIRHFAEIILSLLVFLLVINTIRTERQLRLMVTILLWAGSLAALIGIILYFLPDYVAVRLLSMLRVVRYPSGSGILRYIEDDPTQALRAISTSVDPNVLGGMLIFTTTMAASQALADKPILPRPLAYIMTAILSVCMILTYSRGSFAGLAVALVCLGIRYPRKAVWILAAAIVFVFLPPAQNYITHFIEGLQQKDLATQMRLGEYKDAFRLIQRYPWFGVGFGGTPDNDLYLGVSSVYLLIASEMGIPGLISFLIILITYLVRFITLPFRSIRGTSIESIALGTAFAVVGAMVGGIFDHYLFNLVFPHAAALLWLVVGLGTVSFRLARQQAANSSAVF